MSALGFYAVLFLLKFIETWSQIDSIPFVLSLHPHFWDLSCLIVAQDRFDGRLARLREAVFERRANPRRRTTPVTDQLLEDLLTLIMDLESQAKKLGSVEQMLDLVSPTQIKAERARARRLLSTVLEDPQKENGDQNEDHEFPAPSPVMLRSPGRMLDGQAREQVWPRLPVNPSDYVERLQPHFAAKKKDTVADLVARLGGRMNDELARIETLVANRRAHRYALYRAALELYGVTRARPALLDMPSLRPQAPEHGPLLELGRPWMEKFFAFTADEIGCSTEIFLEDFLRALIWESQGLMDEAKLGACLNDLGPEERSLALRILNTIAKTGRENFRDAQADRAENLMQTAGLT